MEEQTYQDLVNKLSGLSTRIYSLARDIERFHKRNAVPYDNPLPVLAVAKEFLQNTSYTIDTIADQMAGERDAMEEYLAEKH